jgi:tartrate dehydratase alpha subunit/fumarate hydratase class I-like protein
MPKLSPKDITSAFIQHGYYLRPDALKTLKVFLKGKQKKQGKATLSTILSSVTTVIESNTELADG